MKNRTDRGKLSEERTELAKERTELAEERTHLAYIRTGLSAILAGLFFIGFFEEKILFNFIGYAIVILGILFLVYGFYNMKKQRK